MFWEGVLAEREGFEPPIALRLCLISSQVHSTGLCHLSAFVRFQYAYSLPGNAQCMQCRLCCKQEQQRGRKGGIDAAEYDNA